MIPVLTKIRMNPSGFQYFLLFLYIPFEYSSPSIQVWEAVTGCELFLNLLHLSFASANTSLFRAYQFGQLHLALSTRRSSIICCAFASRLLVLSRLLSESPFPSLVVCFVTDWMWNSGWLTAILLHSCFCMDGCGGLSPLPDDFACLQGQGEQSQEISLGRMGWV